jgi:hypothetical protein
MKRRFSMIAYTGAAVVLPFWGNLVFDINGISHGARLPSLRQHDPLKSVGVIDAIHKSAAELRAEGFFLNSADGLECCSLMEQGYPWQASVCLSPSEVEILEKGEKAMANGVLHEGPAVIFRSSTLAEISFVSLGADSHTSIGVAAAASLPAVTGEWQTNPELRAEFANDFNRFMAFRKGVESGQINICIGRVIKG